MNKITIVGEIILQYLEDYGATMYKLQLARFIYSEHPELFNSVDHVRTEIRYYTESLGSISRAKKGIRFTDACQPRTESIPRTDFTLPKVNNNCLILSDLHVQYHDLPAINAALTWGIDHNVNTIIFNGDFMDFYRLSRFAQNPMARDLRSELDAGYEMMYYIANRLPKAKIFFLPGNHEFRLSAHLERVAPVILGAEPGMCDLDNFLHFADFGVTYLKNSQLINVGKLFIGHGHEFYGGAGGVNPSRTFTLRTGGNFLAGHFHRTSEDSTNRIDGDVTACWSMGCLCGLYPEYMPYNKWNHGFARVLVDNDENFKVFNARIFNGKVL